MTLRANPFALLPLLLALASAPALAARADLDQQILVDAARQSIDIDKGVVLFEGNVVVRQGTLEIISNPVDNIIKVIKAGFSSTPARTKEAAKRPPAGLGRP